MVKDLSDFIEKELSMKGLVGESLKQNKHLAFFMVLYIILLFFSVLLIAFTKTSWFFLIPTIGIILDLLFLKPLNLGLFKYIDRNIKKEDLKFLNKKHGKSYKTLESAVKEIREFQINNYFKKNKLYGKEEVILNSFRQKETINLAKIAFLFGGGLIFFLTIIKDFIFKIYNQFSLSKLPDKLVFVYLLVVSVYFCYSLFFLMKNYINDKLIKYSLEQQLIENILLKRVKRTQN